MPRGLSSSAFMKPFVVLALPGMYLFYKYNQYRRQQQEQNRRKVTERELAHLNHKIDKLLSKLEENEPELATSQEDECVICVNAKATMQTSPCGHRVVCRKCFVKTIQMAVSQRLLPLRCVICRAKILRLKQSGAAAAAAAAGSVLLGNKSWVMPSSASTYSMGASKWVVPGSASSYSMGKAWVVPSSASQYSMGSHGSVPNSASLYSMTSGSSSLSGVSSVSSATNGSQGSTKSGKCPGPRMGYPRQPTGSLRKSQTQAMKLRIQEYKEPVRSSKDQAEKPARLPPIKEFQREFRAGKERTAASSSTRIRCAQKIVTQLETTPLLKNSTTTTTTTTSTTTTTYFRSPLKPANKEDKKKGEKRREDKKKDERKDKDENLDNKKKEEKQNKKSEKKEAKADKKEEKKEVKTEKKDSSKTDKKESKKEAKTEKKESKKEAKAEKKKEKKEAKADKKEKD
ncbi:chromatin assembly factor 1 subunit A-B [Periplaneta americana]|uniref:chromatin assembly factor 1 subunit A-B n=1 Tax=Periplaneta americana TaxID=6978 RepID=UPI0037E74FF8